VVEAEVRYGCPSGPLLRAPYLHPALEANHRAIPSFASLGNPFQLFGKEAPALLPGGSTVSSGVSAGVGAGAGAGAGSSTSTPKLILEDADVSPLLRHIRSVLQDHANDDVRFILGELVMTLSHGDQATFASRVGQGNSVVYMLQHGMINPGG
jgi:hypothetical protein